MATTSAAPAPIAWAAARTARTGALRPVSPPPKSAAPHAAAEARPRTTDRAAGSIERPSGDGRGAGLLGVVGRGVERGRARQDDDAVGLCVVARRGGQVDHLEVRGQLAKDPNGAGGPVVVERHERVVEDERRAAVLRDQAHQAEARGEVDLVEGPLREILDADPVATLWREDPDVQRLVIDADAAIAAAGQSLQVAAHALLEVPGRLLHRGPLGLDDRVQGQLVDPRPALQGRELLAPRGEPLHLAGDLLRIDQVLLDPRPRAGLVVAGTLEGALLVPNLHLQPLAGTRLLGDRSERLEGAGLLLDVERGGVAQRRQRLRRRLPYEPFQLRPCPPDRLDVRILAGQQVLGRREVGKPERRQLRVTVGRAALQVLLELAPAAK